MRLAPKDQDALARVVGDLREIHGSDLHAVILTGEATTPSYRPRRSPLTVVVLLSEVTTEALRRTRKRVKAWRRWRVETPLLMDPHYVNTSLDVFPVEFLEIQNHHELLFGEKDPFRDLSIDSEHLRLEVEEQMRGKMLHLWEAYLETGSQRELRRLLLETPPGFEVILRAMLRLNVERGASRDGGSAAGPVGLASSEECLRAIEQAFALELPALRRLEAVRRGTASLEPDELDGVFDQYLGEVRALVHVADSL